MLESRVGFPEALIGNSIVVTRGVHRLGHVLQSCEQLMISADSNEERPRWESLHYMTAN
jgi:hypothetical protein